MGATLIITDNVNVLRLLRVAYLLLAYAYGAESALHHAQRLTLPINLPRNSKMG